MRFITLTGSVYEVDDKAKKVRRLNGKENPTRRMGKDGDWRPYAKLFPNPIKVGKGVVIIWDSDVPLQEETIDALSEEGGFGLPMTTTSMVVELDETVYN